MNRKETMAKLEKIPMEEKLKLLSEIDRAFIRGYIERALFEQQRAANKPGKAGLPAAKGSNPKDSKRP